MIDIYLPEGAVVEANRSMLLSGLAECLLRWTDASELPIARDNAGAYLHVLPAANVTAGGTAAIVVRIDVKIPEVVLSTIERRRGFIADATEIVGSLWAGEHASQRTWVTISNTVDGGWGIGGHGFTNEELDEF